MWYGYTYFHGWHSSANDIAAHSIKLTKMSQHLGINRLIPSDSMNILFNLAATDCPKTLPTANQRRSPLNRCRGVQLKHGYKTFLRSIEGIWLCEYSAKKHDYLARITVYTVRHVIHFSVVLIYEMENNTRTWFHYRKQKPSHTIIHTHTHRHAPTRIHGHMQRGIRPCGTSQAVSTFVIKCRTWLSSFEWMSRVVSWKFYYSCNGAENAWCCNDSAGLFALDMCSNCADVSQHRAEVSTFRPFFRFADRSTPAAGASNGPLICSDLAREESYGLIDYLSAVPLTPKCTRHSDGASEPNSRSSPNTWYGYVKIRKCCALWQCSVRGGIWAVCFVSMAISLAARNETEGNAARRINCWANAKSAVFRLVRIHILIRNI